MDYTVYTTCEPSCRPDFAASHCAIHDHTKLVLREGLRGMGIAPAVDGCSAHNDANFPHRFEAQLPLRGVRVKDPISSPRHDQCIKTELDSSVPLRNQFGIA